MNLAAANVREGGDFYNLTILPLGTKSAARDFALNNPPARFSFSFALASAGAGRAPAAVSEKFFHAQSDQTKGFSARVFPGIEEGQEQHQRGFFEPRRAVVIDGDAVLEGA
jgi:hypothetical protein